jgi:integrase
MARQVNRLTARTVATIRTPGRHADGNGLYLVVDPSGARRWLYLFRWQGKLKEMGLGGTTLVSLAEARSRAAEARRLVHEGTNPIEARRAASATAGAEPCTPTFGTFADTFVEAKAPALRNAKHVDQWRMTLGNVPIEMTKVRPEHAAATMASADALARLRAKPLPDVDTAAVLAVLKPIWSIKPETASRTRGRIESVLAAAKVAGHRTGDNPAAWKGHLDHLLPSRHKFRRGHHAAMPYPDVPAFVARLRERESLAALALEFAILTAARTGEVLGATWAEIDVTDAVWTVPAQRMKAGREHRVPLTEPALAILRKLEAFGTDELGHLFPGSRRGRPLSNMAMEMILRRMGAEATVHGFRSSFRDWCGEETSFPREIAEQCLAHRIGNAAELAYRRGDALAKRRPLMEAWARYCEPTTEGNVVELRRGGAAGE